MHLCNFPVGLNFLKMFLLRWMPRRSMDTLQIKYSFQLAEYKANQTKFLMFQLHSTSHFQKPLDYKRLSEVKKVTTSAEQKKIVRKLSPQTKLKYFVLKSMMLAE